MTGSLFDGDVLSLLSFLFDSPEKQDPIFCNTNRGYTLQAEKTSIKNKSNACLDKRTLPEVSKK